MSSFIESAIDTSIFFFISNASMKSLEPHVDILNSRVWP